MGVAFEYVRSCQLNRGKRFYSALRSARNLDRRRIRGWLGGQASLRMDSDGDDDGEDISGSRRRVCHKNSFVFPMLSINPQ